MKFYSKTLNSFKTSEIKMEKQYFPSGSSLPSCYVPIVSILSLYPGLAPDDKKRKRESKRLRKSKREQGWGEKVHSIFVDHLAIFEVYGSHVVIQMNKKESFFTIQELRNL